MVLPVIHERLPSRQPNIESPRAEQRTHVNGRRITATVDVGASRESRHSVPAHLSILSRQLYDQILLGRPQLLTCLAGGGTAVARLSGHTAPVCVATPPSAGA